MMENVPVETSSLVQKVFAKEIQQNSGEIVTKMMETDTEITPRGDLSAKL